MWSQHAPLDHLVYGWVLFDILLRHATSHYNDNADCTQCYNSSPCPLDSGSAGNFISGNLCRQLKIHTTANSKVYQVQSITGRALSRHDVRLNYWTYTLRIGNLHEEDIKLLVSGGGKHWYHPWPTLVRPSWTPNILAYGRRPEVGRPMLSRLFPKSASTINASLPDPLYKFHFHRKSHWETISWNSRMLCSLQWRLLPYESLTTSTSSAMGPAQSICYRVESVPKGKIYPLSLPEQKAMEGVHWGGSPTGVHPPFHVPCCFQLLFRRQKDGGLRPCIDLPAIE